MWTSSRLDHHMTSDISKGDIPLSLHHSTTAPPHMSTCSQHTSALYVLFFSTLVAPLREDVSCGHLPDVKHIVIWRHQTYADINYINAATTGALTNAHKNMAAATTAEH